MDFRTRRRVHEWMDAPNVDPRELDKSLRFIRRINSLLGYTRSTLSHLRRFSRRWDRSGPITILDVATGSADVPSAFLDWASRTGFDVRIVGVDRHPLTAQTAARCAAEANGRIRIVRGDALALPFADASFDYVLTSMFLHHLDDEDVVRALHEMDRVARRGIVAADLLRHRRAYAWIWFFTLRSSPMLRHDARASVAQGFTRPEVLDLRRRSGLDYAQYTRHFGHRFVLAGEKPTG